MSEQDLLCGLLIAVVVYIGHTISAQRHQAPRGVYIQLEPDASQVAGGGCLGIVALGFVLLLVLLLFGGS